MPQTKNVNDYLQEGYEKIAPTGKVQSKEEFDKFLNGFDTLCQDQTLDVDDIDYQSIFEKHMPRELFRVFKEDKPSLSNETRKRMVEEAAVAIGASYFDQFIDRCITRQMVNFSCGLADTVLKGLIGRVDAPCSDYVDRRICEFPLDPPPDICCRRDEDDEPARFFKLGDQRCWRMPKACTIDFAFAIHRNLVCTDPNGEVRRMIDERVKWFDIIDEKALVRLMFGMTGTGNICGVPYSYDGTTYSNGYFCDGDGPWTNIIEDPDLLITGCTEAPLCAIEQIFEDMKDPYNCMPVSCPGALQMLVTRNCKKYPFLDLIQPNLISYLSSGGSCNTEFESSRQARDGWSNEVQMSLWIYDLLHDFYDAANDDAGAYTDCGGDPRNYNAADVLDYVTENTYLVSKSWDQTWAQMIDFDVQTREHSGTDTWQYFDRGIVWARRYERKSALMWMRPWLTLLIRAFDPANPGGLLT